MIGHASTAPIVEVRVFSVPFDMTKHYTMSNVTVVPAESIIVELVDAAGRRGHGEACMASPISQPAHAEGIVGALTRFGPAVLGLDPTRLNQVHAAMSAALEGHREARSAVDIACWDLMGKQLGRSVVDLLGGARMERVVTYHVVPIDAPEAAAATATELQDVGLTRLQLKAGGRPIDQDIASIHAVAAVIRPGSDLAVDTNRGWTTAEAIQVSNACASVTMSMEQPCATEAELGALKGQIRHPLVVDESAVDLATIARMVSTRLADGFGLKLSRLGGLTTMRAVRDLCMAARVPMSTDDAWGGDITAAAGVAIGATLDPKLTRGAWIAHPYHDHHYDEANGPRLVDGYVTVPAAGPGLGLQIPEGHFGEPVAVYP